MALVLPEHVFQNVRVVEQLAGINEFLFFQALLREIDKNPIICDNNNEKKKHLMHTS